MLISSAQMLDMPKRRGPVSGFQSNQSTSYRQAKIYHEPLCHPRYSEWWPVHERPVLL